MSAFTIQQKVRFQHCDPAGIVFYPRYFEMANITVEEWFDQRLGLPFETFHGEMGLAVPSVRMEVDFHKSSRQGDLLDFSLVPIHLGRSSVTIRTMASCQDETRLTIRSTLVQVEKATMTSRPWPSALRERISKDLESETQMQATRNDA